MSPQPARKFSDPGDSKHRHLRLVDAPQSAEPLTGIAAHPSNGIRRRPELVAVPPLRDEPALHPSLLVGLAVLAIEVLDGTRSVSQLQGMVTEDVLEQFRERVALRTELRSMTRNQRRCVPLPVGLRSSRPASGVVEAAVVLRNEARAFAIAVRLDFSTRHNMWRASCLTVL